GLDVAQSILTPLQGGAFSSSGSSPGITTADIEQAKAVLADATERINDAVAAYKSLNLKALPSSLQPNGKYGKLLALLPTGQTVVAEMNSLLDTLPPLLGIGQPGYYLVIAMDRSELRPGGGFQGNYGVLELDGGKQSSTHPLALEDTYTLDKDYFLKYHGDDI